MTKPSPFYKDEKERQLLIQERDAFKFEESPPDGKLVVLVAGKEGSGKTHLACTMAELGPAYLIDTEYRAQIVTRKFKNVKVAVAKSFMEMVVIVKHILKHQPPGTIIIDSGSDLQTFAEIEYLERSEKEKVGMPWNWAEVWRLCNAIIDDIKFSRKFNLVVTARMKEEYLNDKPTGQMIPRIYSTLPYKADVVLNVTAGKERRITVTKNGFSGELNPSVGRESSLPQLIARLSRADAMQVPTTLRKVS
jgi:hypothetical protein